MAITAARPLVPRARARVAALAVLAAAGVAALGVHVAGGDRPAAVDVVVGRGVEGGVVDLRTGGAAVVGEALADLGGVVPVSVCLLALAVVARRAHGRRGVAFVLGAPAVATVTTSVLLKPVVGRVHHGVLAYPSGHTTALASVVVTALVLLAARPGVRTATRVAAATGGALLVAAVGVSLVGRGYHHATDTVGGLGVALAVVPAAALGLDAVATRTGRRSTGDRRGRRTGPGHPVVR